RPPPPRPTLFPYTTLFRSSRLALPPALAGPQADPGPAARIRGRGRPGRRELDRLIAAHIDGRFDLVPAAAKRRRDRGREPRLHRSEEHTSELQSPCNLVCR